MRLKYIELYNYQRLKNKGINRIKLTFTEIIQVIIGKNGGGKAQPLYSLVKVPGGWKRMGDMMLGDVVSTPDGKSAKVIGVYPQGIRHVYKITFRDGRFTYCDENHLWQTYRFVSNGKRGDYAKKPFVVQTKELVHNFKTLKKPKVYVPLIKPNDAPDMVMPIDPYVLGVLIGDGCLLGLTPVVTTPDEFIVNELSRLVPSNMEVVKRSGKIAYSIVGRDNSGGNTMTNLLREIGLHEKSSWEKSFPESYLEASHAQRLSLLQGLMDTDGYISDHSTCSYCTTSATLAKQVQTLVRSLGWQAKISVKNKPTFTHNSEKRTGRVAYNVHIVSDKPSSLFRLPKKKERANDNGQYCKDLMLSIRSIEYMGQDVTQCIMIDHPDHLYITDDYIVTHNSSLIRELSPLPPDNADYVKGGSKHVILEHKGQTYELMSLTGTPSRHSFKCNNVELNESKNLSAQKELVEVHFGYTGDIHELLLGLVNGVSFTTMTPAKRKEWLMALYPNDLTYITNLHDKFKTMLRDAKGGIRTSSTHLSGLYDQRGGVTSVDELQAKIDHLQLRRDRIARLVSEQVSTENHQLNIDSTFVNMQKLVNQYRNPIALTRDYRDRQHIVDLISEANGKLQQLEYAHQTHTTELKELSNNEVFKQAATAEDKERLEQQQRELTEQLERDKTDWAIAESNFGGFAIWAVVMAMDEFNQRNFININRELLEVLAAMQPMDNEEVTVRQYDTVTKLKYDLGPEIEKQTDIVNRIAHKLRHLDSADRTECPSCHHKWIPGVSPAQIEELRQRGVQEQKTLDNLTERMAKCEQYISTYALWYASTSNFNRFMAGHYELRDIFAWLVEQKVVYTGASEYVMQLMGIAGALPSFHRLTSTQLELEQIAGRLKMFDSDAVEWHKRRYQEHEDALNRVIEEQAAARMDLAQLNMDLNGVDDAHRMVDEIKRQKGYVITQVGEYAAQTIASIANTEHRELGDEQRTLTSQLFNSRSLEGTILSTEQHIELMKQQEEVLKLLVKASSPTEGVVAEQLSEFIECFMGNMNAEINEIWDDVLQIKPCNMENGSLSYKFPLLSGEFDCETADIAESSTGESQVINWVFRLVVMDYLGFSEYPLYGDEIGANFDEKHRPKLMEFLKKCASSGKYSQIFLISHYIAQHGVLTHAEVCALSTDGVALPERYNDHVVMS